MTPNFALNLTHEGIRLVHRSPGGAWIEVGDVALDDPNLAKNMAFLRATAQGLEGRAFATKLVVPASHVLFRRTDLSGVPEEDYASALHAELEAATGLSADDLIFDLRRGEDGIFDLAAVEKATLDEAEVFAVEHRFNPVSFAGHAGELIPGWEPYFGRTDFSHAFLGSEAELRDDPEGADAAAGAGADRGKKSSAEPLETPAPRTPPARNPDSPETSSAVGDEAPADNIFTEVRDSEPAADRDTRKARRGAGKNRGGAGKDRGGDKGGDEGPKKGGRKRRNARRGEDAAGPAAFTTRRDARRKAKAEKDHPVARIPPRIALSEAEPEESGLRVPDPAATGPTATGPTVSGPTATGPTATGPTVTGPPAPTSAATAEAPPIVGDTPVFAARDPERTRTGAVKHGGAALIARLLRTTPAFKAAGKAAGKAVGAGALHIGRRAGPAILGAARKAGRKTDKTGTPRSRGKTAARELQAAPDPRFALPPGAHETSFQVLVRDRRVHVLAAVSLVILVLAAIAFAYVGAQNGHDTRSDTNTAPDERAVATAIGISATRRAEPRPSDFSSIVARATPSEEPKPLARAIRPERRSRFEGGTDPDAGLPDTANPVTDLSERELSDIRAAGFEPPTQEELAETADNAGTDPRSRQEIAAAYERTGILQGVRQPPNPRADQVRDDVYVASLDPPLEANDAIILPDFRSGPGDDRPPPMLTPLPPDRVFDLDDKGLVKATEAGVLNPLGVLVRRGKPEIAPPAKPDMTALVPPDPLAALKPKGRPATLKTGEDAIFVQGRLTIKELRARRGRARPMSVQMELETGDATPSELAVLTSFQPPRRPSDFEKTVEKTRVLIAAATPATDPIPDVGPILPTRASVAKRATIKNAIRLSQLNLIGVYGTEANRRALLRLPSGRYVKVKQGDRIDGGLVAAIGVDVLAYVKGGRTRKLRMPKE